MEYLDGHLVKLDGEVLLDCSPGGPEVTGMGLVVLGAAVDWLVESSHGAPKDKPFDGDIMALMLALTYKQGDAWGLALCTKLIVKDDKVHFEEWPAIGWWERNAVQIAEREFDKLMQPEKPRKNRFKAA